MTYFFQLISSYFGEARHHNEQGYSTLIKQDKIFDLPDNNNRNFQGSYIGQKFSENMYVHMTIIEFIKK